MIPAGCVNNHREFIKNMQSIAMFGDDNEEAFKESLYKLCIDELEKKRYLSHG